MDLLLINAEITKSVLIESISEQAFDEIMDVNFNGAYFTLNRFISILNEDASVIFLSSTSAIISPPMASVYASSKAAFITGVSFHLWQTITMSILEEIHFKRTVVDIIYITVL